MLDGDDGDEDALFFPLVGFGWISMDKKWHNRFIYWLRILGANLEHHEPLNLVLVLFGFDVFSSDCAKLDVCSSLDSTGVNLGN